MTLKTERLKWLKMLRSTAIEAIEQVESGLHFLSGDGNEHLRDAAEAWLAQHRSFAAKLDRRIRIEGGTIS